ncbi:hypothetical protein EVAR_77594_1 [Eumeta japonica]|uniref:Uncharacterized protein n=1 Tax=Eumeta variegata TaxID=151549 RepID=A0A4C1TA55_EUMVA|nr:hypothetical protein EVAR_77594_1 [Eumeta japonica]
MLEHCLATGHSSDLHEAGKKDPAVDAMMSMTLKCVLYEVYEAAHRIACASYSTTVVYSKQLVRSSFSLLGSRKHCHRWIALEQLNPVGLYANQVTISTGGRGGAR